MQLRPSGTDSLSLYKETIMASPQRIEQIQDYLLHQADDRFVDLIYSMVKTDQQNGSLNPTLKEKLASRALISEQNIRDGKVYTRQEAESKLRAQLGI